MNFVKYSVNHEIIKFSDNANNEIKKLCSSPLELNKIPTYNKRLTLSKDILAIKFIDCDINRLKIDTETYLISEFLENKFTSSYFLPYIAITNVINFNQDMSESLEEITSSNSSNSK